MNQKCRFSKETLFQFGNNYNFKDKFFGKFVTFCKQLTFLLCVFPSTSNVPLPSFAWSQVFDLIVEVLHALLVCFCGAFEWDFDEVVLLTLLLLEERERSFHFFYRAAAALKSIAHKFEMSWSWEEMELFLLFLHNELDHTYLKIMTVFIQFV